MANANSNKITALDIPLDPSRSEPLYRQIADAVWEQVADGTLESGNRLPTVRQTAIDLGVHPDTVSRAYRELELLGVVVQKGGFGTIVGIGRSDADSIKRERMLETLCARAVSQAEQIGFTINDVIDTLAELRRSKHGQKGSE